MHAVATLQDHRSSRSGKDDSSSWAVMIIIRLMGGLGNQMFQYAAARTLADRLGVELKLDCSFFQSKPANTTPRSYMLDVFSVRANRASGDEIAALLGPKSFFAGITGLIRKRLHLGWEQRHLYRERHFHYDRNFVEIPDGTYLIGMWQSDRYFDDNAEKIMADFAFVSPPDVKSRAVRAEIESCESVSLHIRRGDYASDPKTASVHGTCGTDYYVAAADEIARRVTNPRFYIFSDDPDWVRDNFCIDYPTTLIDWNPSEAPHEDLRLMASCRHNIIANSSFSWWGGWLNRNPHKVVIAPRCWFRDSRINTDDLIPSSWTRI